ncbi:Hypothetical predicted protein, partial [Pelobates cultripes]
MVLDHEGLAPSAHNKNSLIPQHTTGNHTFTSHPELRESKMASKTANKQRQKASLQPPDPRWQRSHALPQPCITQAEGDIKLLTADLKHNIRADFQKLATNIKRDVQAIGDQTAHLKDKMEEVIEAHNTMADAYTTFQSQLQQMEKKMVDLEDRAHRNNIMLSGIPEEIKASELKEYVTQLFRALLPEAKKTDLHLDRVHRPAVVPSDMIVRPSTLLHNEGKAHAGSMRPTRPGRSLCRSRTVCGLIPSRKGERSLHHQRLGGSGLGEGGCPW